jgi:hypothetical protein
MILRAVAMSAAALLLGAGCAHWSGGPADASSRVAFSSLPSTDGWPREGVRTWTNAEGFAEQLELLVRPADGRRVYLYHAHISVCSTLTGACKPHRFELAFDETGACLGLRVPRAYPFTKAEHDPFTAADYRRIEAILRDPVHPLGDLPAPRTGARLAAEDNVGIDGVTGATLSYYAEHAVPKAFYTSHAVWYAAHRVLPDRVRAWTREWVRPAQVRSWVEQGDAMTVWWLLDGLEATAIPRAEAVDLAYDLLSATDARIPPAALRYLRRTSAPFRPASCRGDAYPSIPDEAKPDFLAWWAAAGFASDALDAALRADLAARTGPSSPVATAILKYLEQSGRAARGPDAWRPVLERFAAGTTSTYLGGKARRLIERMSEPARE